MSEGTDFERFTILIKEEMRRGFAEVDKRIADLSNHLSRVHKRRRLSEQTKRRHLAAVRSMGGMCPCCRGVKIVDDSGKKLPNLQWDHWKAPGCNGVKVTWPVCDACNGRLEDPAFKGRKQNCFASYQDFLLGPDGGLVQRDLFCAAQ